jgi:hypothetical protein
MFRLLSLSLIVVAFASGCNRPANNTTTNAPPSNPAPGDQKSRVNVNAPGVNVDVQGKGGNEKGNVKVNAPGVDVDVSRKQ